MNFDFNFDYDVLKEYAFELGLTLGMIVFVLLGLYFIGYITKWVKRKLLNLNLKSLKVFGLELINVGKQELIISTLANIFQLLLYVLFLYFTLVVVLAQIPATESIADQLIVFITKPLESLLNGFITYLPDLFNIVITLVLARYLIGAVKYISEGVVEGNFKFPGFEPRTARITGGIITFLLYVMTIIIILPSMPGYESLAFKGIATFLGALITIGGSSVIANYMAGIVLAYMHSFEKGDWVEIGDTTGQVIHSGAFAIRLISYKKEEINLPNSKVLSTGIRNYGNKALQKMMLHTEVSIGYDILWTKVEELLLEAARRTEFLNMDEPAFVLQKKLDDFYIVYELNAKVADPSKAPLAYSAVHSNILDVFNEAEIEILSPHYRAQRDGSESTLASVKQTN